MNIDSISFTEETPIELNTNHLKDWLTKVCNHLSYNIIMLSYVFVDDQQILEINKSHLQHDYYTDIITFDFRENPKELILDTEIYISIDRIKDNSQKLNIPYEKELKRVMVHGILHLVGFDDVDDNAKQLMREKESELIKL